MNKENADNKESDSGIPMRSTNEKEPLCSDDTHASKVRFPSCRLVLVFMAFWGFVNLYSLRFNLSVALVAMVNHTHQPDSNVSQNYSESINDDVCEPDEYTAATGFEEEGMDEGEFNWDSHLQGIILAAFFYGYTVTQIPGGWLADRIGGKKLFGGGMFVTAGLTLLTPVTSRCSVYLLIALRVLQGMGEGVIFPATFGLLSRWIPPAEKSRAATFIISGLQLGIIIGMQISGFLCDYGFAGGWPSVFYVFGAAGCAWSFVWLFLCHDSPSVHPRISVAEKQYIVNSLESRETSAKLSTPWKKIATSLPFWACTAAMFANNWGNFSLLTCLPIFLHDVLRFDMTQNGILSALPYVVGWMVTIAGGQLADWLRAPNRLQRTTVVKLFCAVGLLVPGFFLCIISLLGCNRILVVLAIVISSGTVGLSLSGYQVSFLDIAPRYAGTMMGISNTVAAVSGIISPQVVGALTYHESTRSQWQKFFYISTAIYWFGAAVFVAFGSGDLQDWAVEPLTTADGKHNEAHSKEPERDSSHEIK